MKAIFECFHEILHSGLQGHCYNKIKIDTTQQVTNNAGHEVRDISILSQVIEAWKNHSLEVSFLPPLLDSTISSRYNASTLISTILKNGMFEQFDINVSYSKFIDACNPTYCTYTVTERRNIITLISTLLGAFSGLNVAMVLIVPLVMRPFYQYFTVRQSMYITIFLFSIMILNHLR